MRPFCTRLLPRRLTFETGAGRLFASKAADGEVELDFPRDDAVPVVDAALEETLKAACRVAGPIRAVHKSGQRDLLVTVDLDDLKALDVDLKAIARIGDIRGVCVCARGDVRGKDADFSSRWFGPGVGIDEDPVTGSAHTALAPLFMRPGTLADLVGYQDSPRGGVVNCVVDGDRVRLRGAATTVVSGSIKRGD